MITIFPDAELMNPKDPFRDKRKLPSRHQNLSIAGGYIPHIVVPVMAAVTAAV